MGARHAQAHLLSNKTHYSPTDPDARISVKPGKARALNYLCRLAVDTAHGIISHVQADYADQRDSLHLPRLLTGLQRRLRAHDLPLRELLADAGYANGPNYALLEAQHITTWIPVFGQYKADLEGFAYDPATDAFTCVEGKALPFQKYDTNQDGAWHKIYGAVCREGQQCPRKPLCAPRAKRKQINRTIYDAAYRPGHGSGSRRRAASACAASAKARSSLSSGICCPTMVYAGSTCADSPGPTKPCCSRPWLIISKSYSSTGLNGN